VAPILQPASRTAFPSSPPEDHSPNVIQERLEVAPPVKSKSGVERMMTRFVVFVLVLGALAGAFYAGRKYKGPVPFLDQGEPVAEASPTPAVTLGQMPGPIDESLLRFDSTRQDVDRDANAWLTTRLQSELTRQSIQTPLSSSEPEFLYFYGRASLLAGNLNEAAQAFESAIAKAQPNPTDANATLIREATFGLAAVALKLETVRPVAQTRLEEAMRRPSPSLSPGSPPASSLVSPLPSP